MIIRSSEQVLLAHNRFMAQNHPVSILPYHA